MDFFEQLNTTVSKSALYGESSALVLLVSGGADSTALLHAFASGQMPPAAVIEVLHVNHMLRGKQSDADEAFVRDLCTQLDIACYVVSVDVEDYATQRELNLEDAGRIIRYEAAQERLSHLCDQNDLDRRDGRIVTAHTLDDRIENFFWRALWGAGTGALGSIPVMRDNIIRPLISATRTQIIDYLNACGQSWREDATNEDTSRTRAAIRHILVPACEQVRPSFRRSLERTMDLAAGDNAILERMEQAFARDFVTSRKQGVGVAFSVPMMRTLDRTMRARTIRHALFETFPESRRIDGFHIDALTDAFDCDAFARDLGFDLRATMKCDTLKVAKMLREGDEDE